MRHYIPLQTETGWAVAYGNHRGEFISVMECPTLETAYGEAREMTLHETKEAIAQGAPVTAPVGGNRYLRRFQQ